MAERRFATPDADFAAYMNNYYDAVEKWWSANGVEETELKPLKEALSGWNAALPAHVSAQQRAEAARQNNYGARRELEAQARPITSFIQGYPKTTDADRATIGITVRDASGTPTPTTRPQAFVQSGQRLTHTLRLTDESTPTRRARPKDVQRAKVFVALTAPGQPAPVNPGEYRYIGSVTRGETTLSFESDKGGMQAHYLSRWVSTSGATGPWSDTASATVAG